MDHVAQHLTHDLKRVQQFGLMDFDQLKGLINDEDLQSSQAEWIRGKNRKWYHMTHDAFVNFLYEVSGCFSLVNYLLICPGIVFMKFSKIINVHVLLQREIAAAQEEAIRRYKDTLITGTGVDKPGSSSEMEKLALEAVAKKKKSLSTDLNRYLAIANPANGSGFLTEVCNIISNYRLQLDAIHIVSDPKAH